MARGGVASEYPREEDPEPSVVPDPTPVPAPAPIADAPVGDLAILHHDLDSHHGRCEEARGPLVSVEVVVLEEGNTDSGGLAAQSSCWTHAESWSNSAAAYSGCCGDYCC